MSKLGLAAVSLIAAIPGGILTILLVMTFLSHADKMSGMLWVISVPTLLTSVLVAVLPVGVMLFGPKTEAADAETDDDMAVEDEEFGDDESLAGGEVSALDDDEEEGLPADEGDELTMDGEDDFDAFDDDSSETIGADSDDLFMEDDDDFGLEEDED